MFATSPPPQEKVLGVDHILLVDEPLIVSRVVDDALGEQLHFVGLVLLSAFVTLLTAEEDCLSEEWGSALRLAAMVLPLPVIAAVSRLI
jgi:hypothetical protein